MYTHTHTHSQREHKVPFPRWIISATVREKLHRLSKSLILTF